MSGVGGIEPPAEKLLQNVSKNILVKGLNLSYYIRAAKNSLKTPHRASRMGEGID